MGGDGSRAVAAQWTLRADLPKEALGTFVLKGSAVALSLFANVALARLLGPAQYGLYALAIAVVSVLGVPGRMGLPNLIVRNVAAFKVRSAWAHMRGLLKWANQVVLGASLVLVAPAAFAIWALTGDRDTDVWLTFGLALCLIPLTGLAALRAATLRGLGHVVLGQLPETLVKPGVFIVIAAGAYLLSGYSSFTAAGAMIFELAATAVAFVVGVTLLLSRLPSELRQVGTAYDRGTWLPGVVSFAIVGGLQVINQRADILMLGVMRGTADTGIYQAASRTAEVLQLGLTTMNTVLAPTIARLYAAREIARLQQILTTSTRLVTLFALPVALGLMSFGRSILATVFGQDFASATTALGILSAAQLLNVGMGSVGLVLMMTGHEVDTARGVGIATVVNVVLCAILIPRWGIEGAATATAVSLATWNLLLALWAYRRLGLHTTAIGRIAWPH